MTPSPAEGVLLPNRPPSNYSRDMIKQRITDPALLDHLSHVAKDDRYFYILCDGQVRLTALSGTLMLNEMQANFHTGTLETYVLGKAYLAGALLASTVKGNDRIQLSVECGGPLGGYFVEAWACGAVRGYLKHNPIPLDKPLQNSNLSLLYGPGFLSVSKILEGDKQPYTGQVMLEYGNLAKDLALYYQQSEQTPSVFDLSVQFDPAGHVSGAGALFFQVLPGYKPEVLDQLEKVVSTLKPLGAYLETGKSMEDYVQEFLSDLKPEKVGGGIVGFSCPCDRNGFAGYLKHLPSSQREDILQHGPFPLELVCVNCGSVYTFTKDELEGLLNDPAAKEKQ